MPATHRSLAFVAALATSAALGMPSVALAADGESGATRIGLKHGTLGWGVKESFRKYVNGIAFGSIATADGAEQAADNGPFTFTGGTGSYDTGSHAVAATFQGSVRFTSRWHGFDIKLADLKVSTQGTGGAITADVTASGTTQDDVKLASLNLSGVRPGSGTGGAMTFTGIPAKLTAEGAKAFNGMYQEGQELDPVTLSVTPAAPATSAGKPDPGSVPEHTPDPIPPTRQPAERPATKPRTETDSKPDSQPDNKPDNKPGSKPGGGPDRPGSPASAATADIAATAATGEIVGGALDWGVKKSFRDYVTGPIGGGKAELDGGAAVSGAGYRFPKGHGTHDATKSTLDAGFNGSLRFLAHSGALDLKFGNLKVKVQGTKGTLSADVSAKSRTSGKITTTNAMPVADLKVPSGALNPAKGVVTLDKVPATLTAAGATAFDNMYKPGQSLDPVTLVVSVDKNAQLPSGDTGSGEGDSGTAAAGAGDASAGGSGSPSFSSGTAGGSLAATGSGVPSGTLLGTATALVLAGGATMYATRRRTTR
ncbi:HtaA domain-containing protein [Streptomyces sp. NPDC001339]|uniref:HtaA domain-containing protein n=1 Tax=Streptomyces sp. NPDC001339 TaxID=3364563 RepID=UPI0036CB3CB6